MSNTKRNFWLDVILTIAFVLAMVSGIQMWLHKTTPAVQHLWREVHGQSITVIIIGVVIHLIWHQKWIAAALKPGKKNRQVKSNRLLDIFLLIAFLLVMASGFIGGGQDGSAIISLDPFHLLTSAAMAAIVLAHLALHWKWIMATTRRMLNFDGANNQKAERVSAN